MVCDYGCEKEAKFKLKNNKNCCSNHFRKCSFIKEKIAKINTGKKHKKHKSSKHEKPRLLENNSNIFCSYCLKKEAKYLLKNGKYCCNDSTSKCDELKRKNRELNLGEKNGFFGQKHKLESKDKMKNSHLGVKRGPHSEEHKIKISRSWTDVRKEEKRQYMLNGGIVHTRKFIKKISNEEIKLRDLVKELYPNCEFQYPVFRYAIDVAIPKYKIAIEFDGWFHFDTGEHKEYHKMRQEKIEKEGWKFLRYTIFDKFPNLEKIKEDIRRIIN